jgi:uncharacterized BrkB/YihY/UPF0761 family membrane protein
MTRREILTLCLIYPAAFVIVSQCVVIGLMYVLGDHVEDWHAVAVVSAIMWLAFTLLFSVIACLIGWIAPRLNLNNALGELIDDNRQDLAGKMAAKLADALVLELEQAVNPE